MTLDEARYFDPAYREVALRLYREVADAPLICPHGHVDPLSFAQADYQFGTPVELLIIPDHYVFRMLYSYGISMEALGIPTQDGTAVETDHRKIWQIVADHWHLFNGTPTGIWVRDELDTIFGITEKLNGDSAQRIYDQIAERLASPDFTPRNLYDQFNIEILATTDAATDTLEHHQTIRDSGWHGRIVPTFRPDAVVNLDTEGWRGNIDSLSAVSGVTVTSYTTFIQALEQRRAVFKDLGATATDHAVQAPYTEILSDAEADAIFQRALKGEAGDEDARRFTGHMLVEMARMSADDGLVMQIHPGSFRNHNPQIFQRFGRDMGADMPTPIEYTRNLKPLLDKFGNTHGLHIILFTLDETTLGRELAPLVGHYPALFLGPPWWFYDSLNGMAHFFDQVMETTGIYNTTGFNDDTRAFLSIPSRHDVWRRASANWLASLVGRSMIDEADAQTMNQALAYGLAQRAYKYS
jgi:glucuronate isomerase